MEGGTTAEHGEFAARLPPPARRTAESWSPSSPPAAWPSRRSRPRPIPQPDHLPGSGELIAARAHDLEVLTEQFNDGARATDGDPGAAAAGRRGLDGRRGRPAQARDHVRAVAYGAYTGDGLCARGDADERLRRRAARPGRHPPDDRRPQQRRRWTARTGPADDADRAQAEAEQLAADAQAQVERARRAEGGPGRADRRLPGEYDRLNAAGAAGLAGSGRAAGRGEQAAAASAAGRRQPPAAAAGPAAPSGSRRPRPAPAPAPHPPPAARRAAAAPVAGGQCRRPDRGDTAMAQLGDPYVWAAAGPERVRLLGPHPVRLRGRRHPAAALVEHAVDDGQPGPASALIPATCCSSTARSATSGSTSATARWCMPRRPASRSRPPRSTPWAATPAPGGSPADSGQPAPRSRAIAAAAPDSAVPQTGSRSRE